MKFWYLDIDDLDVDNAIYEHMIGLSFLAIKDEESFLENCLEVKKGDICYITKRDHSLRSIAMFKDDFVFEYEDELITKKENLLCREIEILHLENDTKEIFSLLEKQGPFFKHIDSFDAIKNIINSSFESTSYEALRNKRNKKLLESSINSSKLLELQKTFQMIANQKDSTSLFEFINKLEKQSLRKLLFKIQKFDYSYNSPISLLRKEVILLLLQSKSIDEEIIERLKQKLNRNYDSDVYRNWKYPFSVLYYLYYFLYEDEVKKYLNRLVSIIRRKLNIESFTISNEPVDFNGERNQGNKTVWFSIFNNNFSKHIHAFQLFLSIDNGQFKYGLYHMDQRDKNEIITSETFNLRDVLKLYSQYLDLVKHDNSKEKALFTKTIDILTYKKQIILQGPPGTGKTRLGKIMARYIVNGEIKPYIDDFNEQIKIIQFHPSYSYEDFVRGIVAVSNGNQIEYKTENKILVDMAEKARKALGTKYFLPTTTDEEKELILKYAKKYVLVIDEINRANLATVFGELIYALEYRDETVESIYDIEGSRQITLPSNFYIIGTMNTADRSIGHIDYAIRRRFTFVDMLPDASTVNRDSKFLEVQKLFKNENNERADTLSIEFHPDDVMLGHSYFIADTQEELENKFDYQVKPLLMEYIKDGVLLEHAQDIIKDL